jgi:hypothetical protein
MAEGDLEKRASYGEQKRALVEVRGRAVGGTVGSRHDGGRERWMRRGIGDDGGGLM